LVKVNGLGGGTGKYPYRLFGLNPLNVSGGGAGGNAGFGSTLGGNGGTGKYPYRLFGVNPPKVSGGGAGGNAGFGSTLFQLQRGSGTEGGLDARKRGPNLALELWLATASNAAHIVSLIADSAVMSNGDGGGGNGGALKRGAAVAWSSWPLVRHTPRL
jgi:hypothetical protein